MTTQSISRYRITSLHLSHSQNFKDYFNAKMYKNPLSSLYQENRGLSLSLLKIHTDEQLLI
jgi:hypothetical protein